MQTAMGTCARCEYEMTFRREALAIGFALAELQTEDAGDREWDRFWDAVEEIEARHAEDCPDTSCTCGRNIASLNEVFS